MMSGNTLELLARYRALEVREDLAEAQAEVMARMGAAGDWWSGAERVAIAAEARAAAGCTLCRARKEALSPYAVSGRHDAVSDLAAPDVEVVHRLVTDPQRLSKRMLDEWLASGREDAAYVELLGVVVATLAIDTMHRTIGMPLLPLPEAAAGLPQRRRPTTIEDIGAWLPVQSKNAPIMRELLAEAMRISNVARGLSLSPRAMRDQVRLVPAQYVPITEMTSVRTDCRAISRAQIELIAGRVSSLNECFY